LEPQIVVSFVEKRSHGAGGKVTHWHRDSRCPFGEVRGKFRIESR
jgi:hypothetical protein